MPPVVRLILELERRHLGETVALGQWDLTLPCLCAIQDGTIATWLEGRIPSSPQLSLSVPHAVRQASWEGLLFIKSSDLRLRRFIERCRLHPDLHALIQKVEVLQAVTSLRVHAEALLDAVTSATYLDSEADTATHPITGETAPPDLGDDTVPFRFGSIKAKWNGVNADDLADFMRESRLIDARRFISTILEERQLESLDVRPLDNALLLYARTGDGEKYRKIVESWNSAQRVFVNFGDKNTIIAKDGSTGYQTAVEWCSLYLQSVLALEADIKEFLDA